MKIRSFFYSIKQGFANIFRNKWFSLASIATIGACLFLFGIFYCVVVNVEHMVQNVQKGVSVTVFFDQGITEDRIDEIRALIDKRPEVDHTDYISADAAWEEFKEEYLGEYADGFTENPLADSASINIFMANVSKQSELVSYLESVSGVRTVNKSEVTATTLTGVNGFVAYISAAIIIILLAVSIFLISNTVTMGISVRKEEIAIMKYIGATDYFVRAPFVIEGMIIGAVGAAIPDLVIYFIYNKVINYFTMEYETLQDLLVFLSVHEIFRYYLPISMIVGVGIGFFGSSITVRRHLKV